MFLESGGILLVGRLWSRLLTMNIVRITSLISQGANPFSVTFSAMDALSWHEYRQSYLPYRIPGYITPIMTLPKDHTGSLPEETLFVTSPNAPFIPNLIGRDSSAVTIYEDGRFGPADFSIFPQWYFPSTYYLPFVRQETGRRRSCFTSLPPDLV